MEIKNETVFVIYRNRKPYPHVKKPVYLKKNHATGQITSIAKDEAQTNWRNNREKHGYKCPDWWDLSHSDREDLINKMKKEFEVVEYGPKN